MLNRHTIEGNKCNSRAKYKYGANPPIWQIVKIGIVKLFYVFKKNDGFYLKNTDTDRKQYSMLIQAYPPRSCTLRFWLAAAESSALENLGFRRQEGAK